MKQTTSGGIGPQGTISAHRTRDLGELHGAPVRPSLGWRLRQLWHRRGDLPMGVAQRMLGSVQGVILVKSEMRGTVYSVDWSRLAPWQVHRLLELLRANTPLPLLTAAFGGQVLDYGVLSRQQVTDTGVGFLVDAFANSVELETMKYHGLGTGAGAEGAGNTALTTEITTNHYTTSVRPTGTTEEGASANIYKTIGTHTQATAGDTITEHGVFSSATPGAGVMIDRHTFTGVPLSVGDSFQTTYSLTFTSGG